MKEEWRRSPLDVAVRGNSLEIALYLFNHGCRGDEDKNKILMLACEKREMKVVKELVEQHNVNPKGESSAWLCMH